MEDHPEAAPPASTSGSAISFGNLARIFFRIGSLSWGGGAATLAMLHQEFCEREPLLTHEEFEVFFSLSRMVPGMNLLSLSLLIGHRLRGFWGGVLALTALTIPSFAIIVAASLLLRGRELHGPAAGAVHALGPAAAGLLIHTGWKLVAEPLRAQTLARAIPWALLAIAATVLTAMHLVHPAWLVVAGGAAGVIAPRKVEKPS
jgi:chromate transporter